MWFDNILWCLASIFINWFWPITCFYLEAGIPSFCVESKAIHNYYVRWLEDIQTILTHNIQTTSFIQFSSVLRVSKHKSVYPQLTFYQNQFSPPQNQKHAKWDSVLLNSIPVFFNRCSSIVSIWCFMIVSYWSCKLHTY